VSALLWSAETKHLRLLIFNLDEKWRQRTGFRQVAVLVVCCWFARLNEPIELFAARPAKRVISWHD